MGELHKVAGSIYLVYLTKFELFRAQFLQKRGYGPASMNSLLTELHMVTLLIIVIMIARVHRQFTACSGNL